MAKASMPMSFPTGLTRWMCFVDGENLTIEAQKRARDRFALASNPDYYEKDVFVWFPAHRILDVISHDRQQSFYAQPIRTYYYTTKIGNDDALRETERRLSELDLAPRVFKRKKGRSKTKGLDITLAADVLGHAFRDNLDVAFLFAGDGDYLPLIEELKRLGKFTCVCFFDTDALSEQLRISSDRFISLDEVFDYAWQNESIQ